MYDDEMKDNESEDEEKLPKGFHVTGETNEEDLEEGVVEEEDEEEEEEY